MAFKFKYRLKEKFEAFLLNKKAMIGLAIAAPVMFSLSALYLGGYFGTIIIPFPKLPKMQFNLSFKKTPEKAVVQTEPVEEKTSIFKDILHPLFGDAVYLDAPTANMNVQLTQVGLDQDQALEAPKEWNIGGWYKFGARPGEKGNIIIAGHYDDNYGKPAAFWQLKNLKVDDKVFIEDRYGKKYTYSVTESFLVSINDPNRLQIFEGDENHSTLTLLTCGGVWLPGRATYDKRLVVKADLVNE